MTKQNKTSGPAMDSQKHTQADLVIQHEQNSDMSVSIGMNSHFPAYVNTIQETARGLKMSEKSVRRIIDRNLLSASRGLRHIKITGRAIAEYLAKTSK